MSPRERPLQETMRQHLDRHHKRRSRQRSLAEKVTDIEVRTDESPWADHEFQRGYAVMILPFSTGHLLALRVSPQNPFAPYVSVWHRPPDDEWSIFVDGPALKTACPRYWGPALRETGLRNIDVTWTGPTDLRVEMDEPELVWTVSMSTSRRARTVNAANTSLPLWTWKRGSLLQIREWIARQVLDVGAINLSFTTPSGHDTVFIPEEEYSISESDAVLSGDSLGEPIRLAENPTIGDVSLPIRPSFVIGQVHMRITDHAEYAFTREHVRENSPGVTHHRKKRARNGRKLD